MTIYDQSEFHRQTIKCKNDKAKEEYISKEINHLKEHNEDSISLYDLGQVARINEIHNNARRMFSK